MPRGICKPITYQTPSRLFFCITTIKNKLKTARAREETGTIFRPKVPIEKGRLTLQVAEAKTEVANQWELASKILSCL